MIISFLSRAVRLAIAGLAAITFTSGASADDKRGDEIRAAMVYNFSRYAQWTDDSQGAFMVLCVSEDADIADELSQLSGRAVGNRTLSVRLLSDTEPSSCNMAYLSQTDFVPTTLAQLHEAGALTVSDIPGFSRDGMVGLVEIGRQTRFEVNNSLARDSGVILSSRLLRLAVEVR